MLTTNALGPENTLTLHLPSKTTNPIHTTHANEVIHAAAIPKTNQITINISSIIQKAWRIIHRYVGANDHLPLLTPQISRLRLANLAARSRMMVLYDQAKKHDALVIGTENFSEHLLGYYTRFGDEASDLEPIRHLYKTQVIELAKSLGVPQAIINKPPSADLWASQTDANELGFTYQQADPVLDLYTKGKTPAEIATTHTPEIVEKVIAQVEKSAFKHQVPYHL
jgi:NAD+ synthase